MNNLYRKIVNGDSIILEPLVIKPSPKAIQLLADYNYICQQLEIGEPSTGIELMKILANGSIDLPMKD